MGFQIVRGRGRPWLLALALLSFSASTAGAQGPAPETAPPLFPGGGLISYNPIFTTRGLIANPVGNIPLTARPTFSHEGDFNFTWGFYRDFDLTVLVPVVTNHFAMPNTNGTAVSGGTGLGDALLLVKYRFYLARFQTRHHASLCNARPQNSNRPNKLARCERKSPARESTAWFRFH
jgi:hypothetical protein